MNLLNPEAIQMAIGLDPFPVSKEQFINDFLPASIVAYSDGEIDLAHPEFEGEKAERYGKTLFSTGSVVSGLRTAALQLDRTEHILTDYQRSVAELYLPFIKNVPHVDHIQSAVAINQNVISFEGGHHELKTAAGLVIDYGPGLAGLSHTNTQMDSIVYGQAPYCYLPISRLPFTNEVLLSSYNFRLGEGARRAFMEGGYYMGREDGIASATTEAIHAQLEQGATTEVADVIIACGLQKADHDELRVGFENAYQLLRKGGAIVIRSVVSAEDGETSASEMIDMAHSSGFSTTNTYTYTAEINSLSMMILRGEASRAIMTALIIK